MIPLQIAEYYSHKLTNYDLILLLEWDCPSLLLLLLLDDQEELQQTNQVHQEEEEERKQEIICSQVDPIILNGVIYLTISITINLIIH